MLENGSFGYNFLNPTYRTEARRATRGQLMTELNNADESAAIGLLFTLGGAVGFVTSIVVARMVKKIFGDNKLTRVISGGIAFAGSGISLSVATTGIVMGGSGLLDSRFISREISRREQVHNG